MENIRRVLVIDDEENMRHMLSSILRLIGYKALVAENGQVGLSILKDETVDAVLCDIRMPGMDGMEFLHHAMAARVPATIIMMSAYGSLDTALSAIRQGAYDYISKPFKAEEVELTLRKAEEREGLRRDNKVLRHQLATLQGDFSFGAMVARSKIMQDVFMLATKVAPHGITVLITGESGTGKELIAQGIHEQSGRTAGRFIAVNCGGIPETLIESELFGYKKGAFTGAEKDKPGLFVAADGGTLFLDEIGELPISLQVKLLRVLQEGEIQPIGSAKPYSVDVRIVAATNRDLVKEINKGLFRQDLYYRLNVVHIHLPPLRERTDDIPILCEFFIKRHSLRLGSRVSSVAPAAMSLLLAHDWPGNVRELENVLERAMVLAEKRVILPENLPTMFGSQQEGRRLDDFLGGFSIKQAQKTVEKTLIRRALDATGGNKTKASELLEISYPSLLYKMKEFGIG